MSEIEDAIGADGDAVGEIDDAIGEIDDAVYQTVMRWSRFSELYNKITNV